MEERIFLIRHKIKIDEVLDATHLSNSQAEIAAKNKNKLFYIGRDYCSRGNHRLKTRNQQCIQCETAYISYIRRVYKPGYVYIAASIALKVIKIGVTDDIKDREKTLIASAYGGACDWNIVLYFWTADAGRLEQDAHKNLRIYSVKLPYIKTGKIHNSRELFRCKFSTAWNQIKKLSIDEYWSKRK